MFRKTPAFALAAAMISLGSVASASPLVYFDTVYGTDYKFFGDGGMRGTGTGSISVTGLSGTVERAIIHWHGPSNSTDPTAGAAVTFNGTNVVGTNIGFAADNCWGFANSQAYVADVTGLIAGDGTYSLTNFLGTDFDMNGVTLEVFYDDGDGTNDRDIVMFHGNDSNISSAFDPEFWQAALNGVNYSGGPASIVLSVADGQNFPDEPVLFSSSLTGTNTLFPASSWPGSAGQPTDALWDVKSADITSFLGIGTNNCSVFTNTTSSDCLGLIAVAFNLPAGAAPPPPNPGVPEPASLTLLAAGLGLTSYRRRVLRRRESAV